jgi:hypothetical protein
MKTWVRKTLSVGVLAAGALLIAPGAAHADVSQNTSGNVGILNGTQVFAPVAVPLNLVGNSASILGQSNAAGSGINWIESGKGGKARQHSWNNVGIGNGTQAYLPITVPVNIVGNAASVLGQANAAGSGVNKVESGKAEGTKVDQNSSGNYGILNGSQVYAPVTIPINVCGNSLSILGLSNAQAMCINGGKRHTEGKQVSQNSSGNVGILNGTQLYAPLYAPLNIAGNSIGVAGEANSAAAASNESGHDGNGKQNSSGNYGVLNGTQVYAPLDIPVNVCGNALAVLGQANASAACANGTGGQKGHHHGDHDGNGGDNGGDNGDYDGDAGDAGDDDGDYAGDSGSQGGDHGYYGDQARETHGKSAATEAGGVDGLTQSLSNAGGLNVAGLDVLDTLKN